MSIRTNLLIATSLVAVSFSAAFAQAPTVAVKKETAVEVKADAKKVEAKKDEAKEAKKEAAVEVKADAKKAEAKKEDAKEAKKEAAPAAK